MKLVIHPAVEPERLDRIVAAAGSMEVVNAASEAEAVEQIPDADAFFGKMTPALAITLCNEIAAMHPQFVEEPVPQENADALALVARSVQVPVLPADRWQKPPR